MKVNGKEYGYSIEPFCGKVKATIYRIEICFGNPLHIQLISKEFGSVFRSPINKDYENAKEWASNQLDCIFNANSNLTI